MNAATFAAIAHAAPALALRIEAAAGLMDVARAAVEQKFLRNPESSKYCRALVDVHAAQTALAEVAQTLRELAAPPPAARADSLADTLELCGIKSLDKSTCDTRKRKRKLSATKPMPDGLPVRKG